MEPLAVERCKTPNRAPHKLHGVPDDGVEHRLDIGRRAPDDAQDLAGGRLLLEGLGEVGILGLQLAEQPGVLDGDGRLVGEGLHQGDVTVGERQDLVPVDDDHPEQLVRPEHRDGEHGPDGLQPRCVTP